MKTSELIKELKQFGEVSQNAGYIDVYASNSLRICTISTMAILTMAMFDLCTDFSAFQKLNPQQQVALFNDLYAYASTPLDQRKDESKFRVRLWNNKDGYLNDDVNGLMLDNIYEYGGCKTSFTKSEYEALGETHPEAKPFLPPFNESDPRFVKVGEVDD